MPELPEVESLRLGLEPLLLQKTILNIQIKEPKLVSGSGNQRQATTAKTQTFQQELVNQKIIQITRRAKNLIFHFHSGKILLVHLKMTGQLVYQDSQNQILGGHPIQASTLKLPHQHTHLIFTLNLGTLYYNDVRKFGYLLYYPRLQDLEKQKHFTSLGMEPFDPNFTTDYLYKNLKLKNLKLKTALLGQSIVTGLGNIYCDEVCFQAKVRPDRLCSSLKKPEVHALHTAIIDILSRAIVQGGSSVANYLKADGSRGNYANFHLVYGKTGQDCSICKKPLKTIQLGGRTTVYCPHCQK